MFQRCRSLGPGHRRRRRRRTTGRRGELPAGLGPGPGELGAPDGRAHGQRRAQAEAKPTYKVAFSQNASNNPWRLAETASMQEEATKLGYQLTVTDANNDQSKQIQTSRA